MQETLIPHWKEGARVEIIQSGFTGTVVSYVITGPADAKGRVGVMRDILWVKLDSNVPNEFARKLVKAHATDLRALV